MLYFIASSAAEAKPPSLRIDFLRDGKLAGTLSPTTTNWNPGETRPFLVAVPMAELARGEYELNVTLEQNGKAIRRAMVITLN